MNYFVHESSIIDDGAVIGSGTKVWHFSHVCAGARIGRNCTLGQNVYVGPGVTIGDGCKIQNNVSLYRGLTVGNNVFIGPSAVFTNDLYPRAVGHWEIKPTVLKDNVSVGANATIVCDTILHEGCMVAAGAVVTRSVPAYQLVAGVPARFLRNVELNTE